MNASLIGSVIGTSAAILIAILNSAAKNYAQRQSRLLTASCTAAAFYCIVYADPITEHHAVWVSNYVSYAEAERDVSAFTVAYPAYFFSIVSTFWSRNHLPAVTGDSDILGCSEYFEKYRRWLRDNDMTTLDSAVVRYEAEIEARAGVKTKTDSIEQLIKAFVKLSAASGSAYAPLSVSYPEWWTPQQRAVYEARVASRYTMPEYVVVQSDENRSK